MGSSWSLAASDGSRRLARDDVCMLAAFLAKPRYRETLECPALRKESSPASSPVGDQLVGPVGGAVVAGVSVVALSWLSRFGGVGLAARSRGNDVEFGLIDAVWSFRQSCQGTQQRRELLMATVSARR